MRGKWFIHAVLGFVLTLAAAPGLSSEPSTGKEGSKYLDAVREFADNVLKYGRDTYGPKHTPLFVDGLNVHTREPVKWKHKGEIWYLSNLASQQNLFRVLDGLTTLTGDAKYRQAAVDAIEYAFGHLRTPNGLLYWGGHSAYDALADHPRIVDRWNGHEFKCHYPYYKLMWEVDPKATEEFIEAFWSSHIQDWSNLDMNRHGSTESQINEPWNHKYEGGPVFFKSKSPWGRAFLPTGSSLMQAGTTLHKLSGEEQPLVWSRRLAKRYVDTRHPNTGISYEVYNMRWPELGDDLREHFRDPYTTYFPFGSFAIGPKVYPPENIQPYQWMSLLLMGEMLGVKGDKFIQWAVEELTAWGKASYRSEDNVFIPILTDGTSLEGYVWKEAYGPGTGGLVVKPQPVGFSLLWAYSTAYRITGDLFMWKMVRNIVLGTGFGDIGNVAETEDLKLAATTSCSDPRALLSFLELYKKTKSHNILAVAHCIGENIITQHLYKGFFVSSREHLFTRFNSYEALALLHLHAAMSDESKNIPCVWPGTPSFGFPYRDKEDGVDHQVIYTLTESPEVPVSLQEAAFVGDVILLQALISNDEDINGLDDSTGSTALRRAVMAGHKDAVEFLISKGANINAGTPIQNAVQNGHKGIVEMLIVKGAVIDVKNEAGNTLLHLAAQEGHKDIAELLIEKGIDINAKNNNGQTPAHLAVQNRQRDTVKLLLEKGADINAKDNNGNTLLILALQRGRWDIAKDLIAAGAHVNAVNKDGQSSLHLAVAGGNQEIIELLLAHGADVNAKDKQGCTPALAALYWWEPAVTDLLLENGADASIPHLAAYTGDLRRIEDVLKTDGAVEGWKGFTLLHAAAAGGHADVVKFLITKDFEVEALSEDDETPLHYAVLGNKQEATELLIASGAKVDSGETPPLFAAAYAGHKDMVKFLISRGADINKGPQTALHRAVAWWEMDAVKLLLELGADVNAQNDVGNTPLHAAINTWWVEVAEVLISHGAKIDLKNNQGQTPLIMATNDWFNKMARLLIEKGADIHAKDNQGQTAIDIAITQENTEIVQLLESKGAKSPELAHRKNILHHAAANNTAKEFKALFAQTLDVSLRDAKDNNGFTPLHCAIHFWRTGNAKLLIDRGADLNTQDNEGYTPLHLAAWQGMKELARFLINRGAKLNTTDNWGWTPLHRAVIAKQKDIAKLLIEKGADASIKDKEGRTALWWAEHLKLEDAAELLKETNLKKVEATIISKSKESKPVHGIAITDISAPSNCNQGDVIPVSVSLVNQGTRRETFRVTFTDTQSGKEIAGKEVTLAKGWKDRSGDVADVVFDGENIGINYFGNQVWMERDINGDGLDDILISAPNWNNTRGRVYLYYGGSNIDPATPDVVFSGEDPNTHLGGYAGTFSCDINNDGYQDVLVGARGTNDYDGRVYIFHGGPVMNTVADMILEGEAGQKGNFGLTVTAGDIDNDGFEDILVGAMTYDHERGRVYLFWGGDPMDTKPDVIFEGEAAGDWFGRKIDAGGDVNGDGYNDILIGARFWGQQKEGRAYLFLGNTQARIDTVCDYVFTGEAQNNNMGSSLEIFDIDADGISDVLVGARFAADYRGRVYIYWGANDFNGSSPGLVLEGETGSNMGGDNIACGYFNIDKYADILVGAYNYPDAATRRGRAYVFYGNKQLLMDASWDHVFEGEIGSCYQYFGVQVSTGDANRDGYTDALIGAPGYSEVRGRVYLFHGPFEDAIDITFTWDTSKVSPGKHALKASITPVAGEENTEDNSKTVSVEINEPPK